MKPGLATSPNHNRYAILTSLAEAQRQLEQAKTRLSETHSERDRYVALAVRAGFSHTEIAQRIGVDRSTVSQLLRRNPDLTNNIEAPPRRNGLELLKTHPQPRPA